MWQGEQGQKFENLKSLDLEYFRVVGSTREIGRYRKFAVLSFYNENRYANETSQTRSAGRVVSQNKTRPGIPSLVVEIYVAQNGLRRMLVRY